MPDDSVRVTITADASGAVSGMKDAGAATDQLKVSAAQMAQALKDAGGDLRKVSADTLGLGTVAKDTAAATAAIGPAAAGAATGIKAVAAAAAEGKSAADSLKLATSGDIQEYIRLGHEAMQGNFSRIPGSLVVLASRTGGLATAFAALTPAMTAAIGAAAALTAGLALLGAAAYRAAQQTRELQGALNVMGSGDSLGHMQETAQHIREAFGGTPSDLQAINKELAGIVGLSTSARDQLTKYAQLWNVAAEGEMKAEDIGKEIEKAANGGAAGVEAFAKRYGIALDPARQLLDDAKATKDVTETHAALIALLGSRYDQVLGTAVKLRQAQTEAVINATAMGAGMGGAMPTLPKVEVTGQATAADLSRQSSLDMAQGFDKAGTEAANLSAQIKKLQTDLAAMPQGDTSGIATLTAGIAAAQQKLNEVKFGPVVEQMRTGMAQLAATWDGTQTGLLTKQRDIAAQSLTQVTAGSKEYIAIVQEQARLDADIRKAGAQEAIRTTQEKITAIEAAEKGSAASRLAAEIALQRQLVNNPSLGKDTQTEQQSRLNEMTARLGAEQRSEAAATARALTDAAKEGTAQRVALATAEVETITGLYGAGSTQAIEAQKRLTAATQAETQERARIAIEGDNAQIAQLTKLLDAQIKNDDKARELHSISIQQQLGLDLAAVNAFETQQLAAINNEIATAEKAYGRDSTQFAAAEAKKTEIEQSATQQRIAINDKAVQEMDAANKKLATDFQQAMQPLGPFFDSIMTGMLTRGNHFSQTFTTAFDKLAIGVIEDITKMMAKWLAYEALQGGAALTGSSALGGLVANPLSGGGMAGMLGAMFGGGGAAASGAAAGNGLDSGTALTEFTNGLTQSTTALTSNVSALSTFGADLLSGATSVAKFITSMGGSVLSGAASIFGFASGTASVPHDMMAMVHKGEIIIPADISNDLRNPSTLTSFGAAGSLSASSGGGGGGGSSAGGSTVNMPLNVNALDGKSVVTLLNNPTTLRSLANNLARYTASNPSSQGAY